MLLASPICNLLSAICGFLSFYLATCNQTCTTLLVQNYINTTHILTQSCIKIVLMSSSSFFSIFGAISWLPCLTSVYLVTAIT